MKANRKTLWKLILDVAMLLTLTLLYRKNVLGIGFHEIGGLALIGAFLLHHIINGNWVVAVTKRMFAKETPPLVRARWIVDLLLAIAFIVIGVTGALMSRVVFRLNGGNGKTLHYFTSALAIILMGVHLGLHAGFLLRPVRGLLARRAGRIAGIALLCLCLVYGCYSMATTSFARWLSMPFTAGQMGEGPGGGQGRFEGQEPPEGFDPQQDGQGLGRGQGGPGRGLGQGQGQGSGQGNGQNRQGQQNASFVAALQLIASYLCILLVFATPTALIVRAATKRRTAGKLLTT